MSEPLRFMPPRVQMVDPKTGMVTREWYLFLQGVFDRIGGANGQSSQDIIQDMPDDAGLEEIKATLFATTDAINQTPPVQDPQTLDMILAELSSQRDQITELIKTVQAIQQGTLI